MIRLDKYFSELGLKSRSEIEEDIKRGLVKVNGVIVKKPEFKLDETSDKVEYKGEAVIYEKYVYYILNKPSACVTARTDESCKTVMDLIDDSRADLSPVGRLDKDTTGLLIITNDGELNHRLMSPKGHVPKTYFAEVEGNLADNAAELFESGIDIGDDKPCKPAKLNLMKYDKNCCYFAGNTADSFSNISCNEKANTKDTKNQGEKQLSFAEITITEGRYHQVKRMIAAVGGEVTKLKRVAIGGLNLPSDLAEGEYKKVNLEFLNEHIFCAHGGHNGVSF